MSTKHSDNFLNRNPRTVIGFVGGDFPSIILGNINYFRKDFPSIILGNINYFRKVTSHRLYLTHLALSFRLAFKDYMEEFAHKSISIEKVDFMANIQRPLMSLLVIVIIVLNYYVNSIYFT